MRDWHILRFRYLKDILKSIYGDTEEQLKTCEVTGGMSHLIKAEVGGGLCGNPIPMFAYTAEK
jgi:hypothetical protein